MNTSRKSLLIVLAAILTGFISSFSLAAANTNDFTLAEQDDDGFILYKYSLIDAGQNKSSEITESSKSNSQTYSYNSHTLSCGTKMTGSITKTTSDGKTHVVGEFEVSNNEYGITHLSVDFIENSTNIRDGSLTINDRTVDIKQFDNR